ncbi:MAG: hypothetical protein GTO42_02345 [Candidatus Latescibacteria bacterium]|nr:hypothetical protein [Candidatus Latescibacterota bacterium]NIO00976.1 hypothetical protein [Candidatus Latescibacterota bacterium]NIO27375.1 hypothetical protein [Candidatus Latescibacterota bacterium]NIO54897.1 hypothetical protein [Candidatus Latescibacterota bacterium]NIT00986.1 hypothetical protein [Candidatus Latescibacterota bacterium]
MHRKIVTIIIASLLLAGSAGCASKGLVREKYPEEFYRVPKLLPDGPQKNNPKFVVIGDNQAGWRGKEKFVRKKNWATWKMAIIPFYQLYLIGNGIVGGVNWWRHAPDYGKKERLMVRDAIYAEAKRSKVDFILNVGDIAAHDGRRPSHWKMFLQENKEKHPLLEEVPYLPTAGNHDRTNDEIYGLPNYRAIFDYPRFYVVDFPDAALFVTDSNFILDQEQEVDDDTQDALFEKWFVSDVTSGEPAWLERELRARKNVFKIVAFHHSILSFGEHNSDWTNPSCGRNLGEKRKRLIELFQREGVQLVFSGHDHFYQHIVIGSAGDKSGENEVIHLVVSSGGGAPIREVSERVVEECHQRYNEQVVSCQLVNVAEVHHYCLAEVSTENLTVETFAVTGDPEQPIRLLEKFQLERAQIAGREGSR